LLLYVHQTFGHCYVAAETAFYLLGGKKEGWTPQFVRVQGYAHWYLKHISGFIYDPTAAQFKVSVPYHKGRGNGFLTKKPSKRGLQLIRQIKNSKIWLNLNFSDHLDTQFPKIMLADAKTMKI